MTDKSTPEILKEKFSNLTDGWVTLLEIPVEKAMEINVNAIKVLQDMGYEGVYITLSKDYIELSKVFRENGIDMGKIAFIDGISQMYGVSEVASPNVTYVSGPLSIDALTEAVTKRVATMKAEKKFVFLDSITTILLYNSLEKTIEFSNFITSSFKQMKVVGIVVSISRGFTNEKLIEELTKVSNQTIELAE